MVTANVTDAAEGVMDALTDRDVIGIGALAFLGAGGVLLAQEVADAVNPFLNVPVDPTSPADLGIQAVVKVVGSLMLVALSLRMSGMGQAIGGALAFGMLVSTGADFIDILQRGGLPGVAPAGRSSRTRRAPQRQVQRVERQSSGTPTPNRTTGSGRPAGKLGV